MLYAFPFSSDEYEMAMNARAGVDSLIEVEPDKYHAQITLKESILASDPSYYFQCPLEAEVLAWEALERLLPDMARALPQHFTLETRGRRWTWTNRLLGSRTRFELGNPTSLPLPPLDWMGRQIQEDLILMAADADGQTTCVAGHLCFASGWHLGDKLGRSFGAIHDEVPEFAERIGRPSDLLMRRLKPGRPVGRLNWTIHAGLFTRLREDGEEDGGEKRDDGDDDEQFDQGGTTLLERCDAVGEQSPGSPSLLLSLPRAWRQPRECAVGSDRNRSKCESGSVRHDGPGED